MKGWTARVTQLLFVFALLAGLCAPSPQPARAQMVAFQLFFPTMPIRHFNWRSELSLMNLGDSEAAVSISFFLSTGAQAHTWNGSISPRRSIVLNDDLLTSLPNGNYSLVVSASQPLIGNMAQFDSNNRLSGIYPGAIFGTTDLFFGPVSRDFSGLIIMNTGVTEATYIVQGVDSTGAIRFNINRLIAAGATNAILLKAIAEIPIGFEGAVVVSADQPVTGLLQTMELIPGTSNTRTVRITGPLEPTQTLSYARLLRSVDEYGGPRSSQYFLMNTSANPGTYTLAFQNAAGSQVAVQNLNLASTGSKVMDLPSPQVSENSVVAVQVSGDQPFVFADLTTYTTPPDGTSAAYYAAIEAFDGKQALPRLFKGSTQSGQSTSVISILNPNAAQASVDIEMPQPNGSPYHQVLTVGPFSSQRLNLNDLAGLGANYAGAGWLAANQPVKVIVDEFFTHNPPCIVPQVSLSHLPDPISTTDLVTFTASATGTEPLTYTWTLDDQPVTAAGSTYSTILSAGSHTISVTASNTCGSGTASQTVTVNPPPCDPPDVTISRTPADPIFTTDVVNFNAQATGTAPLTYRWTLDAAIVGSNQATYRTQLSEGEHSVAVTVENACGTDTDTNIVTVNATCVPPRVKLAYSPMGVIFPSDMLHFVATPTAGTVPFHYSWSIDDLPSGTDSPTLDTTLEPGDHYVTVELSNSCGVYSYTTAFTVVAAPAQTADLSQSTLTASTSGAGAGDSITYIAILRNTGNQPSPGSAFSNVLPASTSYVPEKTFASSGTVQYSAATRTLSWAGDIEPGTPVVMIYTVNVTGQPAIDQIMNNAVLTDANGQATELSSTVTYKEWFTFSINDGKMATNQPQVSLAFTYNPNDGLTHYMLSNKPNFANGVWLPLAPSPVEIGAWELDPYGDPRMPRTVYLKYKKGSGQEVGPFMASILFDMQPPKPPKVNNTPIGSSLWAAVAQNNQAPGEPVWNVSTSDDNSGVMLLQISTRSDFSGLVTEVQISGTITEFVYRPSEPGMIYLRAVDRSGNTSETIAVPGLKSLYLPALFK